MWDICKLWIFLPFFRCLLHLFKKYDVCHNNPYYAYIYVLFYINASWYLMYVLALIVILHSLHKFIRPFLGVKTCRIAPDWTWHTFFKHAMEEMMLLPCIAASAQLFACHDTWFETILSPFWQQFFANLARKTLKLCKLLSSAVRNTCVPVSMPRRYLFVIPVCLPCPWFSDSAWAFGAWIFLLVAVRV